MFVVFRRKINWLDIFVGALMVTSILVAAVAVSFSTGQKALAHEVFTVLQDGATPTAEGDVLVPEVTPAPDVTQAPVVTPVPTIDPTEITYSNRISATNLVLLVILVIAVLSSHFISRTAIIKAAEGIPKPALDIMFSMLDTALKAGQVEVAKTDTTLDDTALNELAQLYAKIKEDIGKATNGDPSFLLVAAKGGDPASSGSPSVPPPTAPVG